VGGSLVHDIAVLKIEGSEVIKNSHAISPVIADSEQVRVFDDVFAVGNPEGFGISVTEGKINVDLETLSLLGADGKTNLHLRVMRISAAINEGNSGGGLFNEKGELCGIVCAKRTGDDVDNIAYAIPINLAKSIADVIISPNKETKPSETGFYKYQLGITMDAAAMGVIIDEDGNLIRVEKVKITDVLESSALYGKLAVGDEISSITVGDDVKNVTRVHHTVDAMLSAKTGDSVSITVVRDGATQTFNLTVTDEMLVKVN
jgi:serine protease Do